MHSAISAWIPCAPDAVFTDTTAIKRPPPISLTISFALITRSSLLSVVSHGNNYALGVYPECLAKTMTGDDAVIRNSEILLDEQWSTIRETRSDFAPGKG